MNKDKQKTLYSLAKEQLITAYEKIISEGDLNEFPYDCTHSGLFLGMPGEAYFQAGLKCMVVGQETGGWKRSPVKPGAQATAESIEQAMDKTSSVLCDARKSRSRFLQYIGKIGRTVQPDIKSARSSIAWSNLHCLDWKGRAVSKNNQCKAAIESISKKLLLAQYEILKPDIMVFTTGSGRDKFLKNVFDGYTESKVVVSRRLWTFNYNGTLCYRVNHPRYIAAKQYHNQVLNELELLRDA